MRLTKRSKATSHENGVCCTHFNGRECHEVMGECAHGCKWEEEVWSKVAEYEDLEEQGLLLRLPIPIKKEVYCLRNVFDGIRIVYKIKRMYIKRYEYNHLKNFTIVCGNPHVDMNIRESEMRVFEDDIGKTVFLTKEEAEQTLERMVKENGNVD